MRAPSLDPYNGFKSDRERRLALRTRERMHLLKYVVIAATVVLAGWPPTADWLVKWAHPSALHRATAAGGVEPNRRGGAPAGTAAPPVPGLRLVDGN